MEKLLICTTNPGKLREISAQLNEHFGSLKVEGMGDVGVIEETGETFQENALLKARTVFDLKGVPCLADDSGLEVMALQGRPGVHSARYAGNPQNEAANMAKLLNDMKDVEDRRARFRTVIAFVNGKVEETYEGEVWGSISTSTRGSNGFGYDPSFIPDGGSRTFGEMQLEEKQLHSHRSKAMKKFILAMNEHDHIATK